MIQEVDVYHIFKKYDFNLVVIENLIDVLLKKKDEALNDTSDWVEVKVPRKNGKECDQLKPIKLNKSTVNEKKVRSKSPQGMIIIS